MPDRNWIEDSSHENGNYNCTCSACGQPFVGHKRRVLCRACSFNPERLAELETIRFELGPMLIVQIRNRTDDSRPEDQRIKAASGMEGDIPVGLLMDGHGRIFLKATDFASEAEAKAHMEKVIEACKA